MCFRQERSTPRAPRGAWWEDDDCTECVGIRHWTAQDWALLDIGQWSGWALLRIVCVGRRPTCRSLWPRFPRGTPPLKGVRSAGKKHTEGCPGRMVGGRRLHGDVTRRVTYFLRGRPGWYLEETAWRRKAGHLHVEAESPSEDARCAAACSAGEAQRVEEVAPDGVARTRAPFERATPGRVRIVHWTVDSGRRLGIGQWTQDCCGCRAGFSRTCAEYIQTRIVTCGAGAVQAHTAAE